MGRSIFSATRRSLLHSSAHLSANFPSFQKHFMVLKCFERVSTQYLLIPTSQSRIDCSWDASDRLCGRCGRDSDAAHEPVIWRVPGAQHRPNCVGQKRVLRSIEQHIQAQLHLQRRVALEPHPHTRGHLPERCCKLVGRQQSGTGSTVQVHGLRFSPRVWTRVRIMGVAVCACLCAAVSPVYRVYGQW